MPEVSRLREVALNVATAVAFEAQKLGIAGRTLGADWDEIRGVIAARMWKPTL